MGACNSCPGHPSRLLGIPFDRPVVGYGGATINNRRLLDDVRARYPSHEGRVQRVSLIDERAGRQVRMANLAIVGTHGTNGVARIRSELLRTTTVRDLAELFPERFNNGRTSGSSWRRTPSCSQVRPSRAAACGASAGAPSSSRDLHLASVSAHRLSRAADRATPMWHRRCTSSRSLMPLDSAVEMTGKAIEVVRRQSDGSW